MTSFGVLLSDDHVGPHPRRLNKRGDVGVVDARAHSPLAQTPNLKLDLGMAGANSYSLRAANASSLAPEMEEEKKPTTQRHTIPAVNAVITKRRMNASEAELIQRVVRGETEAFCELVRPYERIVFMAAFAILQNRADAEDAAQDAVLRAFTNLSKFRGEAKFSTWLCRIVINQSLMRLRMNRQQLHESMDEPNDNGDCVLRDFADWRDGPCKELEREELRQILTRAMASLRPKYRVVLMLRDVQQFTIAETAAILRVKQCAVKARLFRARLQMRDALAPALGSSWSLGHNGRL
jgi:RNA polymerase sigma-70 factor (ECF subfamily)